MKFVDQAKIFISSGRGGHGCLSFRREKFVEFGGPDGGDGGRGGDVVVEAVPGLNTLVDHRFQPHIKAKNGRPGEGANRTGASAAEVVVKVPVGTQVFDEETDELLADLTEEGQRVLLAKGGDGGRGNAHFKTSTNRAPRRFEEGFPGEERTLILRLKLLADAGLLGLPNAGKSTFLSAVSAARPKVADYPFTTLHPQLGVVEVDGGSFVLADIPGLIEGAHEGAGLGLRFLGHVERCRVLLHLVDGTGEDVAEAYRTVRAELEAYDEELAAKPEIVALNKCDALGDDEAEEKAAALAEAAGGSVMRLSGVTGAGVRDVLRALAAEIGAQREAEAPAEEAAWQP